MPPIHTAIVRPPAATFHQGITTAGLGTPDFAVALAQHAAYARALEAAGVRVIRLEPDPDHPDSTFVEDTAVITRAQGILTRPGALTRRGEVESMRLHLAPLLSGLSAVEEPGTLDGGDVLEAGERAFIGISERTNEGGARQVASWLAIHGIASILVDIRDTPGLLHLKSGISFLGGRHVLAVEALAGRARAEGFDVVPVPRAETYAANTILVNGTVFLAAGFPFVEEAVRALGLDVVSLEMSEFQKMDGGLSCLSLRFESRP